MGPGLFDSRPHCPGTWQQILYYWPSAQPSLVIVREAGNRINRRDELQEPSPRQKRGNRNKSTATPPCCPARCRARRWAWFPWPAYRGRIWTWRLSSAGPLHWSHKGNLGIPMCGRPGNNSTCTWDLEPLEMVSERCRLRAASDRNAKPRGQNALDYLPVRTRLSASSWYAIASGSTPAGRNDSQRYSRCSLGTRLKVGFLTVAGQRQSCLWQTCNRDAMCRNADHRNG